MKMNTNKFRWIVVFLFVLSMLFAYSKNALFAMLLFFLGGALVAPLNIVKKLREKYKLNKVISVILAAALFFAGVKATPITTPNTDYDEDEQIEETMYEDDSYEEDYYDDKEYEEEKQVEETASETTDEPKVEETPEVKEETTEVMEKPAEKTPEPEEKGVGAGAAVPVNISHIPAYSGNAYVVINNNVPNFSQDELSTVGYEKYSDLDNLGRTKTATASVGKDTMPKESEERGDISRIKPSGWKQAKYTCVSGGWLYNRCHLIGWQLSAENANAKNLLTGTKYLNVTGMLPFENMVADYIKETGNHVAYRITPVYQGNNLLASGVQMEAYSVEDNGEGICFNIYCYNVQPDVTINYADGSSTGPVAEEKPKEEVKPAAPPVAPQPETSTQEDNNTTTVYVTETGKKYHSTEHCSGLSRAKAIYEASIDEAKGRGLTPCAKCY